MPSREKPPEPSPGEATSRLNKGLKNCRKVMDDYRALFFIDPAERRKRD